MKKELVVLSIAERRTTTTVLIATLALSFASCRSSKTVTQQTLNEAVHDTVIETVTLSLHDTIRETTTITIQTNETGDTTRLTANRDSEKITSRDRTSDPSHHLTQTETSNTSKESTTTPSILPTNPNFPIKPVAIAFLFGLLLIHLTNLFRSIKK